jgi:hypothetical protein
MPGRFRIWQPESLPPVRVSNCLSTITVNGWFTVSRSLFLDYAIVCPYHDSRFALNDGGVINGPAVHPKPRLEARIKDGQIQVCKLAAH